MEKQIVIKRRSGASNKELRETWDGFHSGPDLTLLLNSLRENLGEDIDDLLYVRTHAPFVLETIKSMVPGSRILEAG